MSGEKKEYQIGGNLKIEATLIDWSDPTMKPPPFLNQMNVNAIQAQSICATSITVTDVSGATSTPSMNGDLVFKNDSGVMVSMREMNRRLVSMEARAYGPQFDPQMFARLEEALKNIEKLTAKVEELERELADIPKYKPTY